MKNIFAGLLLAFPLLAHSAPAITIGFQKSSGLLGILKNQGTLEKAFAGQQIKWIEFPAGPQMLEALNAGSIDFGSTGAPPPVFGQAAGIDLLYVAAEPAPVNSEAIFVPKDSAAHTVADLKGKKVAFQKGSGSHFLLASALQKAGLKLSDIKPVYLSPSDARAAFVSGGIDAWVVWDPYFASAQKSYQVRVLSDYTGLPQANGFYLASRKFAAQSPKVLSALLEQVALTGTAPYRVRRCQVSTISTGSPICGASIALTSFVCALAHWPVSATCSNSADNTFGDCAANLRDAR